MRFLDSPSKFFFFTGKGGVGKTSLACATAVHLADSGKSVLLVSTDPASNLAQVFGQPIGNSIVPCAALPGLSLIEIDPVAAAAAYRDRIVGPVRGVLPDAVVAGMEEQLSGACTVEIAAFDEFTALLTDQQLAADYDHIIFDTAPTGHTIRLLQLPGAWSGFLESGTGDASCLGPLSGLEKQRSQYRAAVDALSNPAMTRLILVSRAQQASLREADRTAAELHQLGIANQYLAINGLMPEADAAVDGLAAAVRKREQAALQQRAAMPGISTLPTDHVPLQSFNLMGIPSLRSLLQPNPVETGQSIAPEPQPGAPNASHPNLARLLNELAEPGHGLIMLMGKGGVGKTTLAAAIAAGLAARGLETHLTTSDPAAHLSDTLSGSLDHLTVSRIDPIVETTRYRDHVMETKGKDLDEHGRALLAEDLRSPCTEEIAVFQAFSRIIREAGRKFVVMDTAPTGHTLLLLDATGAYHRDIIRQTAQSSMSHVVTPMMRLQDQNQTRVIIVTLAEPTPVLEAAGLQEDLRRAGIEPFAWIINNALDAQSLRSPLLLARARAEHGQIATVREKHAQRMAIVPLQLEEPVGVDRLKTLVAPL